MSGQSSIGSGFLVSADGLAVTNYHVVSQYALEPATYRLEYIAPDGKRGAVKLLAFDIANALFELIFYGVLERYPRLKIVTVENEVGWIPWIVQQWDYYYRRFRGVNPPRRGRPSEGTVGELIDLRLRVLLEPVLVSAFRRFFAKMTHVTSNAMGEVG